MLKPGGINKRGRNGAGEGGELMAVSREFLRSNEDVLRLRAASIYEYTKNIELYTLHKLFSLNVPIVNLF